MVPAESAASRSLAVIEVRLRKLAASTGRSSKSPAKKNSFGKSSTLERATRVSSSGSFTPFSRREIVISLLDARAGSPPTAAQILIRCRGPHAADVMNSNLAAWETWSAELLESCLSFPMLAYYRSQHDNQSWLGALTAILDTSALEICGIGHSHQHQARLTFAIARHAAVDLTLVFKISPVAPEADRLGPVSLENLKEVLSAAGISVTEGTETELAVLRGMYEPFVNGLAQYFLLRLPEFVSSHPTADNWQTSAWMPRTPGILDLPSMERGDHF